VIRLADPSDIPAIVTACRDYYDEIAFGPLKGLYEDEHIHTTFAPCNGPDSVLVIAESTGRIDGVFFAYILRSTPYQRQIAIAQEIVWHTATDLHPSRRINLMGILLGFAEPHLRDKGAMLSAVGSRLSAGAAGKLLEKTGYSATGTAWHKEL